MPKIFDLFCGAGGLSLGFEAAGYEVIGGNDCFAAAGETFLRAHPDAAFFPQRIEHLNERILLERLNLKRGELDCLAGGPPCQAYSVYNHKRGMQDDRAHLFEEYLRIVDAIFPKWVVIENVTGIQSIENGRVVTRIKHELESRGYTVEAKVLYAEDYGVPQERRRFVFLANRVGKKIVWPKATHYIEKGFNTVFDAISDLPELENGETFQNLKHVSLPLSNLQKVLRSGSDSVLNHSAPKLGQINVERLKYIGPGGSWRDIPFDLLPSGMKKAKRSDHTKRYGRLKWDGLASTILTKCDIHWGAYIHPDQNRAITVREAARFQTFPDSIEFCGSKTEQYIQVGNAVPPFMAKAIASSILENDSKGEFCEQEKSLVDA